MKLLVLCLVAAACMGVSKGAHTPCSSVVGAYDYIPGCGTCINEDMQCRDCAYGKTLSWEKTACIDCPLNCFKCDFESATATVPTCRNCTGGNYLEAGVCKPCTTPNCGACTMSGVTEVCTACYTGYVLDQPSDLVTSCLQCPSACKECSVVDVSGVNKATCDACYSGFYKKKTTASEPVYSCSACAATCETCTDNGAGGSKCTKCKAGYALNPATGTCVACPSFCSTCDYDDTQSSTVCTKCVSTRYQLLSGYCSSCTSNCAVCSSDPSMCSECDPYFRLDSGSCIACDTNCIKCDATSCLECATTFVKKDATDMTCDACSANCNTCNQFGCTSCDSGYRLDTVSKTCIKCGPGCSVCTTTACTGCFSSFVLGAGACHACPTTGCSPPTSCVYDSTLATNSKCTTCASGYTRNTVTQTCDLCPDNCAPGGCTYNNSAVIGRTTICDTCNAYFEAKDGLCAACPPHCSTCTWNSTISAMDCDGTACEANTTFIQQASPSQSVNGVPIITNQAYCQPCNSGCMTCNETLSCSACLATHTIDNDAGTCLLCDAYCATGCELNATGTGAVNCGTCVAGYGLNDLKTVCSACSTVGGPGCASCTYTTSPPWTCNSCIAGYAYDAVAKTCGACAAHCLSCTVAGECTVGQCEAGYAHRASDKKCYKCPTIVNDNNCLSCSFSASATSTVPDVCNTCVSRYAMADDNTCKICPDHCNTCTYDTTAAKTMCNVASCDAGYARNAAEGTCHECPPNCGTCSWDTVKQYTVCTNCGSYFYTNGQVCAACPPNCAACETVNGVSRCTTCSVGYALNDGFCKACITNCAECSTISTCSMCKPGYGKTADSTACTACATLTAVDNCVQCNDQTSASAPAICLACSGGTTLADHALTCLDTSPLTDCLGTWDPPPKCTACNTGYNITSNGHCGTKCSVCGSPGDMKLESECNAADVNYTVSECLGHDKCVMIWRKDTSVATNLPLVARGCFENVTCSEDEFKKSKVCQENKSAKVKECKKCCRGGNCNDYVFQGQAAIHSSLALVLAAIFSTLALRK